MADQETVEAPAPRRAARADGADYLGGIGCLLLSLGAGAIYWPAGLIVAGLVFLLFAWVVAQSRARRWAS